MDRPLHKAGIEDRWIDRDPPGRGRGRAEARERPRRGVRVGWDRGPSINDVHNEGSAKRWAPVCINATGKARQKYGKQWKKQDSPNLGPAS